MTKFEYSPAPESRTIVDLKSSYGLYIGGEFVDGSGTSFKSISPATEEVLAEVAEATEADVDAAVKAARRAYEKVWAPMPGRERAKYLYRIARIIAERSRELAVLESLDNGKPIKESRDVDVPLVSQWFFYYAGWADKLGHAGLGPDPKALGVAGQIIPWNFPLMMLAWKIAPALAAGNTVVLKPAETTPLTALLFAEICQQAELPSGVVNIVTGAGRDRSGTRRAPRHRQDRVHRIHRGGPPDRPLGRRQPQEGHPRARRQGGQHRVRRRRARPGGRGHRQRHLLQPGSRVLCRLATAGAGERLRRGARTTQAADGARLRLGDPLDKNTDIGAINSAEQLARIRELSAIGDAEGADRWSAPCEIPDHGFWFAPTIFTGVTQAHRIAREEIFGPVLSVLTFRTPAEAVEKANNTPYGLSAGVWTEKGSRILSMAQQLRAGVVWANTFNKFDPTSPFGGYQESGYGREGGKHGLART